MSTRAIIARQQGDGWEGRYHHFDGYPRGLGATLYALYHGHFQRDIDGMLAVLIDEHPAGWSSIHDADWSQPPAFQPFDAPSPRAPSCYCHGARHEAADLRTPDAPDHFEEWLYVLSPVGRTMSIFDTSDCREHLRGIVRLDDPPPDWNAFT